MQIKSGSSIKLNDDSTLCVERIVREVKHRSISATAEWQGKAVMVHVFPARRRGVKNAKRECKGISWLRDCGIPVPVYCGTFRAKQGVLNVYEHIEGAVDLPHCLSGAAVRISEEQIELLKKMMIELATHHVFGVLQRVPDPSDFLIAGEKIFLTQGANIIRKKMLLSKRLSLKALAQFFLLVNLHDVRICRELLDEYGLARGWKIKEKDYRFVNRRVNGYALFRYALDFF